jgi:hypothetical protein
LIFATKSEGSRLHIQPRPTLGQWFIIALTLFFTAAGVYGLWLFDSWLKLLLALFMTVCGGWATAVFLLLKERFEIDREARLLRHVRSYLGFKTTNEEVSLRGGPQRVLIRSEPVPMNDSPLTFVALYGADGEELDVVRETSLERARAIAAEIAEFLDFEVVNLVDDD